jgi:hypothetical protein
LFSRRRGVGKWKGRSAFQAAGVFSTPALCGSQVWERSIFVAGRQHSPGDSCQFVGCSGHHHVERRPSLQRIEPRSERGSFAFHAYHRRTRSMNQDLTQVAVSSLADTQEPGLAASGMLSGHESEPGCELPALAESAAVADRCHDGRRDQRTDAGNLPQPQTGGVGGLGLCRRFWTAAIAALVSWSTVEQGLTT